VFPVRYELNLYILLGRFSSHIRLNISNGLFRMGLSDKIVHAFLISLCVLVCPALRITTVITCGEGLEL
jgi:uncharacterized paraquat-inducible protein A